MYRIGCTKIRAIVVPFRLPGNLWPSTFPLDFRIRLYSSGELVRFEPREAPAGTRKSVDNLLLLRSYYAFWKIFRDFYHLLGMANLVRGYECEPVVKIELTEKRMGPIVNA